MESDRDKPAESTATSPSQPEPTPPDPGVSIYDTQPADSDPAPATPAASLERPAALRQTTLQMADIAGRMSADNPTIPARRPLRPGTSLGQYQLIRQLGRGGMGAVHLARDTRLGRRVAIKFLTQDDPSMAKRVLAEARVTALCKHDNIVDIYDIGEAHGRSFMVLEYLQGVTLRSWLEDRWASTSPPLNDNEVSPTLAAELMVPVVRALAHAHALGLVHRDLKPENIMLADDGSLKVLDFGLAKVLDHSSGSHNTNRTPTAPLTRETDELWMALNFPSSDDALVGTMPYMSPEQWNADDIDARTDIWAVGVMLWELCTGRHPLEPLSCEGMLSIRDVSMPMPSLVERRPQLGPLARIVDRCLRKPAAERIPSARALLDELEPLLPGRCRWISTGTGEHDIEPDNPYVGLAAFQQADAARFFGRDRDIACLMAQLRNHRLVTVAGASGAGKSSFVRAGVIPALKRSGQSWESFIVRPGRQPLSALADVLARVSRVTVQSPASSPDSGLADLRSHNALVDSLRSRPGHLGAVLRTHCQKRHGRILLFVDQFEELYTLGADRDTRETFVHCLEGVADDASSPLRVVLSVRSDFLDRMAEDRAFTSEIIRGMTILPPLSREQLRQALIEPLDAAGHAFESEAMVEAMLNTLEATRSPLPLLQFTAARLWDVRDPQEKRISQASYDAMGGIAGALATHADAVLASLSRVEQRLARAVFTSLVSDERTRAMVGLDELCTSAGDAVERVVRHLAEARLVLMETDSERGAIVELTHESLIERWPKLVHWLDQDQDAAQFRNRVRDAARQWDKQGRTDDLLWRGQAADEASRWLDRDAGALAELGARDRAYVEAVVGLAVRARRRRRHLAVAGFALVSAVAVAVSLLALRADREAKQARASAAQARASIAQAKASAAQAEASAAQARASAAQAKASAARARNASRMTSAREHQSDPTLVLALVREMEPAGQLPPRWRELARWALYQDIARVVLTHPDAVHTAAFSRDGTRIVTASADNTVRVWNADGSGRPIVLAGHRDLVNSAAFSPDGTRIVTASADNTARVWNADGSGRPIVLAGHRDLVNSAAFSPDGTRIVTASADNTVRVWNADGSGRPLVFTVHRDLVYSAAFSPDGTRIVTASADRTARVWNADGSGQPIVLAGHRALVSSARFSPDGTRIVTASWDKTARVWNADGSGRPILLAGHRSRIFSAAFSPDGTRIVTASFDKTARVWNADGSSQPMVFDGHQELVKSAEFSPDGSRIITASHDKTARVWNVDSSGQPVLFTGHKDVVIAAGFSPDGTRIVTASWDRTVRVWNADGSGQPIVLTGHRDRIFSAQFSPDGTRIVTASWDRTARVCKADGSGQPIVLTGHQNRVFSAAFSPDGTRIVTASWDRTARVWNADGSGQPIVLIGHQGRVTSAGFSPDGTRIITASEDKTARVWSADGSGQPIVLTGHQAIVISAAFSPDGTRIITGSFDKTARVWRADDSGPAILLSGHDAPAVTGTTGGRGAFSPDGSRVVTISDDNTLRVWNVHGSSEPAILRIPDEVEVDAFSAAFSPDGTRIVTASHSKRNPVTGEMEYWAAVWPSFERITGLDDPVLWTATSYCPPVALRRELLGVSEDLATRQLQQCRDRVATARAASR
ncbi:MAG: protein kinase [Proteobacteria bacterium]|nr:protein kinase [Pseudomonadota bacterium]